MVVLSFNNFSDWNQHQRDGLDWQDGSHGFPHSTYFSVWLRKNLHDWYYPQPYTIMPAIKRYGENIRFMSGKNTWNTRMFIWYKNIELSICCQESDQKRNCFHSHQMTLKVETGEWNCKTTFHRANKIVHRGGKDSS